MASTKVAPTNLNKIAEQIRSEVQKIGTAFRTALEHARNVGDKLKQAKAQLDKEALPWLSWVKKNCKFGRNTASNYIRIADNWSELEKERDFAALTLKTALSLLAEPKKEKKPAKKPDNPTQKFHHLKISLKPGYDLNAVVEILKGFADVEVIDTPIKLKIKGAA